jgi:hypothetical protein
MPDNAGKATEMLMLEEVVDLTQDGGIITRWWDTTNDPIADYKDPKVLAKLGADAHMILDSQAEGKEIRFVLKGGPGSGFSGKAGHAGIIGMRGGSTHVGLGGLASFERQHYADAVENAACFDKEGHMLYMASGRANGIDLPWEVANKMTGGTFSHNHPKNLPFSIEDVAFADRMELKEMRVTANDNGRQVVYTMKPKPGGNWPAPEVFKINLRGVVEELRYHGLEMVNNGMSTDVKTQRAYWMKFWQSFSPRMGLVFEEKTL